MSSVDNKNCSKKLNKNVCRIKKVNNFRSFPQYHHLLTMSGMRLIINSKYGLFLTLFKMGLLGAAHGWGWGKKAPLPKICLTYLIMMNLGSFTLSKGDQKNISIMNYADISIFSREISNFCYVNKYRYRLHFNAQFLIL